MPVLLGLKTSGSLFIGILRSETVEDRIIEKFDLKSVYGVRRMLDARRGSKKILSVGGSQERNHRHRGDRPQRRERLQSPRPMYRTRSVGRGIEYLGRAPERGSSGRLKSVKQDLDSSAKEFSQFASNNSAIDIKEQGKAMVEAAASLQGHLIAAQSELEGLRQIYADTNVRVRAVRARIAELQDKLNQMGGGDLSPTAAAESAPLYPSIRKLPLLGVTYAKLYRNNKIQETVFELLTQQCELAKVQEAKETPSVKVLDAAHVPEKKSFPPRLLFMFLGAFLAFMLGAVWVLGKTSWEGMDPQHPGKVLAQDAYTKIKGDLGLTSGGGTRLHQMRDKILWFKRPSTKR